MKNFIQLFPLFFLSLLFSIPELLAQKETLSRTEIRGNKKIEIYTSTDKDGVQKITSVSIKNMEKSSPSNATCNKRQVEFKSHKAKLGVYIQTAESGGVNISSIEKGGAAEKAGLQVGDRIVKMNDTTIHNTRDVLEFLSERSINEVINIDYIRADATQQSTVTLLAAPQRSQKDRFLRGFKDKHSPIDRFTHFLPKDPCKPFIGVLLSNRYTDDGVFVTRTLPNTPAAQAELKRGDKITAINGIKVDSQAEIIEIRDRHEAGDEFSISYIREGERQEVEARFHPCKEETETLSPAITRTEKTELTKEPSSTLLAFPNPARGETQVQFTAEAKPTKIQLRDINGKVWIQKDLPDFGGNFDERLDLRAIPSGTYYIQAIQEGAIKTQSIVVLSNRA